eukprot:745488-Pelagomonas_calceolata.AAC.3
MQVCGSYCTKQGTRSCGAPNKQSTQAKHPNRSPRQSTHSCGAPSALRMQRRQIRLGSIELVLHQLILPETIVVCTAGSYAQRCNLVTRTHTHTRAHTHTYTHTGASSVSMRQWRQWQRPSNAAVLTWQTPMDPSHPSCSWAPQ